MKTTTHLDYAHEQLGLFPPERIHARIDLYVVAGADTITATTGITEGDQERTLALWTSHADRSPEGVASLAASLADVLAGAVSLVGPF